MPKRGDVAAIKASLREISVSPNAQGLDVFSNPGSKFKRIHIKRFSLPPEHF
jgi:hypothetical protein